jgi:hypothetical protein
VHDHNHIVVIAGEVAHIGPQVCVVNILCNLCINLSRFPLAAAVLEPYFISLTETE